MTTDSRDVSGSPVEIYQGIYIPAMISEWVLRVLALVDFQPGEKVLDVACGAGAITSAAAAAVGSGGAVTGMDLGPDMLIRFRALLRAGGYRHRRPKYDLGRLQIKKPRQRPMNCWSKNIQPGKW